jgi:hypothetical protein
MVEIIAMDGMVVVVVVTIAVGVFLVAVAVTMVVMAHNAHTHKSLGWICGGGGRFDVPAKNIHSARMFQ